MRFLAFNVLVVFLASSSFGGLGAREDKKPTDEEITKLLVGKWAIDEKLEMGVTVKGTQTYAKDGKWDGDVTVEFGKNTIKVTASGTWKVKDGKVTEKITKTNHPELDPVGKESTDTVISIDDKVYTIKDDKGKERTIKRVKEEK